MSIGGVVPSLLEKISIFDSSSDALDEIQKLRDQAKGALILSFVNAHAINLAHKEPDFCSALQNSDILLRDGIGVSILYRAVSKAAGVNLNGTDLIPALFKRTTGLRVAVWGTRDPNLSLAVEKIQGLDHCVTSVLNGFHDLDRYVSEFSNIDADIVVLGMGMPKQEMLSALLKEVPPVREGCLVVCGGAILDFLSGNIERAPDIWIRLRFEWLYRLAKEPKRLWRRYLLGNIVFLYRVILISLRTRFEK
jgi:exopolysaccharide biosynthesis WecB/TagA/CpsF family protein